VIIDDLDIIGIIVLPDKTDTPLIIDPNTVLALPISVEHFQAIGWRQ
jgi:hypothetical protein